jgi:hypothetical protein
MREADKITGKRSKLPPVDWKRGQKPAWETRMAGSAYARQTARGGVPDLNDPVYARQEAPDPNDPVHSGE